MKDKEGKLQGLGGDKKNKEIERERVNERRSIIHPSRRLSSFPRGKGKHRRVKTGRGSSICFSVTSKEKQQTNQWMRKKDGKERERVTEKEREKKRECVVV